MTTVAIAALREAAFARNARSSGTTAAQPNGAAPTSAPDQFGST